MTPPAFLSTKLRFLFNLIQKRILGEMRIQTLLPFKILILQVWGSIFAHVELSGLGVNPPHYVPINNADLMSCCWWTRQRCTASLHLYRTPRQLTIIQTLVLSGRAPRLNLPPFPSTSSSPCRCPSSNITPRSSFSLLSELRCTHSPSPSSLSVYLAVRDSHAAPHLVFHVLLW